METIRFKSQQRPDAYWFAIENPDTSFLWSMDDVLCLKKELRAAEVRFDQCLWGKNCQKRTRGMAARTREPGQSITMRTTTA